MAQIGVSVSEWFDLPCGSVDGPVFAIGDVHGCAKELAALQDHLRTRIEGAARLYYLGDYADRGPETLAALDLLRAGLGREDVTETALLGNHDQYLLDAAMGVYQDVGHWLHYGGAATLASLGVETGLRGAELAAAVSEALGPGRLEFLEGLALMKQAEEVILVHAGLNPWRPLGAQVPDDLIWIRAPFLDCLAHEWPFRPLVVHGHSPHRFGRDHHRIGIDSGCYETGILTALEIDGRRGRYHQTAP